MNVFEWAEYIVANLEPGDMLAPWPPHAWRHEAERVRLRLNCAVDQHREAMSVRMVKIENDRDEYQRRRDFHWRQRKAAIRRLHEAECDYANTLSTANIRRMFDEAADDVEHWVSNAEECNRLAGIRAEDDRVAARYELELRSLMMESLDNWADLLW